MPKTDILKIIKARKTVYEFSRKKVRPADLHRILEAARWAPSSHNTQTWSFIVIKNQRTIGQLLDTCFYGSFYELPPTAIAIIMEPIERKYMNLLKGDAAVLTEYHMSLNLSFPVAHMVLEAQSLGIDSFIISPLKKTANKVLHVKPGRDALLVVGLGFEKKGAYRKKRERKPLKDLVFRENYGKK
jgi:nitroreductase